MSETSAQSLQAAKQSLVRARLAIESEIHNYPRPISGCDAQFNHLLADRKRTANALAALEEDLVIPTSRAP
ncbi:MAG: hypothetical protein AAGL24_15260 [Pseudomonadota bacterium]